jgi:hypothetical protein
MRSAYRPGLAGTTATCPACFQRVAIVRGKFIQHWPTRVIKGRPCTMTLKAVPR